jgi:hypothetical protein
MASRVFNSVGYASFRTAYSIVVTVDKGLVNGEAAIYCT